METNTRLNDILLDFDNLNEDDFKFGANIKVYSDMQFILTYNSNEAKMNDTIFGLRVEFGKDKDKSIMTNVRIDDLELFASSILKQIKIVRKNYSKEIKKQRKLGVNV